MKKLGKTIVTFIILVFGIFITYSGKANTQELSDSTKIKRTQEAINAQKAPKVIPSLELQPAPVHRKTSTPPKGGWSEKLTGKEILKIKIEVKTEDDLKFLQDLGLSCCSSIGMCECEVTLEQANQIKARRISFRIERKEELQEENKLWLAISRRVDRVTLGPHQVIMASIYVETYEDLDFLRKIEVNCCADTGICKCEIDKEQWKQIGFHGFRFGARVVDTKDFFLVRVKIKTEEEEEILQRIGLNCGGEGKKEFICRATSEQLENLKKEGIEFEMQKEKKKIEK
jgi:hypothetical protein